MKLFHRSLLTFILLLCFVPQVFAAVDVTPSELQNSANLLTPDGSSLESFSGFSSFYYRSQAAVSGGISTRYQALLLSDPWLTKGLPELQLMTIAYADQDAADAAFDVYRSSSRFSESDLTLSSESSHGFFYFREDSGSGVDLLQSVTTDAPSFHRLEKNGNVLIQASAYIGTGPIHEDSLSAFTALSVEEISEVLSLAVEAGKISLGLLFPPEDALFLAQTESSSLSLVDVLTLPSNGTLELDIYVSDPGAAQGTVLDSSGLLRASDGDFYLYINKQGKLQAGLYAPAYDANCTQSAGWYSITSPTALYPYEWNHVVLHFGVGGFSLSLNDADSVHCSVSQGLTADALYLGDYPLDSVGEGMIGVVDDVQAASSLDAAGRVVDILLANQLFLDLDPLDEDFSIFKALKEKKVFLGSDGFLNAEATLNRAAMVKVLSRALDLGSSSSTVSFWDVPSDAWYLKYLAKAVEIGMVTGRADGSFGGADPVTRAELFTMLERLDSTVDVDSYETSYRDLDEKAWYLDGAAYAEAKGFVTGEYFYPTQMVTRRDAARVLYQLMN